MSRQQVFDKLKNGDSYFSPHEELIAHDVIATFKKNMERLRKYFLEEVASEGLTIMELNHFAHKYKDKIVLKDVENKSMVASRMVLDWYNYQLLTAGNAETGALVYKTKNGHTFGITSHAYERAKERGVTEDQMLHAAIDGTPVGRDRYDDGKTIVVVIDNKILTTYKSADAVLFSNDKFPIPPPADLSHMQFSDKPVEMLSLGLGAGLNLKKKIGKGGALSAKFGVGKRF
jgi:hypothetical protein